MKNRNRSIIGVALYRLVRRLTAWAWMPWVDNPHAVHTHYLRIGNGWEVWTSERVRGLEKENEKLRETMAYIQHYTSCTSLQFDIIEEVLRK